MPLLKMPGDSEERNSSGRSFHREAPLELKQRTFQVLSSWFVNTIFVLCREDQSCMFLSLFRQRFKD